MRTFRQVQPPAPVVFNQSPNQQAIIQRINQQSNRIQQIQSNISLELSGVPRLTGDLIVQRPDHLRLKAGIGGITELGIDVGSNSEVFWIWNKANLPGQPPPAIFYARQSEDRMLQQNAAIPVDPQWVIDATGLIEFPADQIHQGPYPDPNGRLKINSLRQTREGTLTRVVYIDPQRALVEQQAFYDANNRLVAYANADKFEYFQEHDISLPRRVQLHLAQPDGQILTLTINASNFRINSFYGNPDQTWSLPNPDGIPLINLADVQFQL